MSSNIKDISELLCKLESLTDFNHSLVEAINTSHEGIAILDKDGIYTYMNDSHAKMFGYTADEMIGKSWTILYSESDIEWFNETVFTVIDKEGRWSGEATAISKDTNKLVNQAVYLTSLTNGGLICTCRNKNN